MYIHIMHTYACTHTLALHFGASFGESSKLCLPACLAAVPGP